MMKEEYIEKYGEAAYEKQREQTRGWHKKHPEKGRESSQLWRGTHKEEAKEYQKTCKGTKRYEQHCKYRSTGIPHKKDLVRSKHRRCYTPYKQIIAPDSRLHHEWLPETASYRGVALVEKDQHQHGYIDVIQILEGEITLLTEAEIKGNK